MRRAEAACARSRWQHFSAWNDAMAAILKLCRRYPKYDAVSRRVVTWRTNRSANWRRIPRFAIAPHGEMMTLISVDIRQKVKWMYSIDFDRFICFLFTVSLVAIRLTSFNKLELSWVEYSGNSQEVDCRSLLQSLSPVSVASISSRVPTTKYVAPTAWYDWYPISARRPRINFQKATFAPGSSSSCSSKLMQSATPTLVSDEIFTARSCRSRVALLM